MIYQFICDIDEFFYNLIQYFAIGCNYLKFFIREFQSFGVKQKFLFAGLMLVKNVNLFETGYFVFWTIFLQFSVEW